VSSQIKTNLPERAVARAYRRPKYHSPESSVTIAGMLMAHGSIGPGAVRTLVDAAWSAGTALADPDDPRVRAFAEFGLPPDSELATEDGLRSLHAWREGLQIPGYLDHFAAATQQMGRVLRA